MRLLPPNADMPPENQEASSVEIDAAALESNEELELPMLERLRRVAVQVAPEVMRSYSDVNKSIKPEHLPMLLMRVQGMRYDEIARSMNIGPNTVRRILNSPPAQTLLTQLYAEAGIQMTDVHRTFMDAAPQAAEILLDLAENGSKEEVRLKAAFNILDRAGYGATRKSESLHKVEVSSTVTSSEVQALRMALQEALVVEADFEVVERPTETAEAEDAA